MRWKKLRWTPCVTSCRISNNATVRKPGEGIPYEP
jgi:hypothetical protein